MRGRSNGGHVIRMSGGGEIELISGRDVVLSSLGWGWGSVAHDGESDGTNANSSATCTELDSSIVSIHSRATHTSNEARIGEENDDGEGGMMDKLRLTLETVLIIDPSPNHQTIATSTTNVGRRRGVRGSAHEHHGWWAVKNELTDQCGDNAEQGGVVSKSKSEVDD